MIGGVINERPLGAVVWGLMAVVAAIFGSLARAEPAANYQCSAEPPSRPAFIPLPPGCVEPVGWLRDWALAARDGITGRLDRRHITFRDGWTGAEIEGYGAEEGGRGWPLEQAGYWLDGLVRLAYVLHDDALIRKARARLDPIVDGVNAGGVSFIHWRKERPEKGFTTWGHAQMGRALAAYYSATGEQRILDALVRAYADYDLAGDRGSGYEDCLSGLTNLEPMLDTYRWSGDRRILDRVLAAVRLPANERAVSDLADGKIAVGHGVDMLELTTLPAICYPWNQDRRFLTATLNVQQWLERNHMLPYGVISAEEYVSGVGALRCTETCDVHCFLWANTWMLRILGEGGFGDRVERAFFNAAPATVSRDFQLLTYYQSPNRINASLPSPPRAPYLPVEGYTHLGHPVVICCAGNVNRIVPNYIIHAWMATYDNGLTATFYGPCKLSALAGNKVPVQITCDTAYPFEEAIRMKIEPDRAAAFPLYFRVPGWCANPEITVNRVSLRTAQSKKGFLRIEREWRPGDRVELRFPMSARIECGYETEYPKVKYWWKKEAVFERRRLPFAGVSRGPLLFALPIADEDPNKPMPGARWNYALNIDGANPESELRIERKPMPERWSWQLDAPVALLVPAREFDWHPTERQALPDAPVADGKPQTIRLIPYGCTKFRVSMFPVTPRTWAASHKDISNTTGE